jgi:hypothetical protein
MVPVPYYINDDGQLEDCVITDVDRGAGTMTFMTLHTSEFTWVLAFGGALAGDFSAPGYSPGIHGFQIVNRGSIYNENGECMGMTAFSQWWYRNKKSVGELHGNFMFNFGLDARNQPIFGQHIIATRAFNSVAGLWDDYRPLIQWDSTPTDEWILIRHAIRSNVAPTLLYITQQNGKQPHSVLAYGWNSEELQIYDPNLPREEKTIGFADGSFAPYGNGYVNFHNNGMGSLMREDFNNIYEDAQELFWGSGDAFLTELSHDSGDHVEDLHFNLTGKIESGAVLVDYLKVYNDFATARADLDVLTGEFSVAVPVKAGENRLTFTTKGSDGDKNRHVIPNNINKDGGMLIFSDAEPTQLRILLNWQRPRDPAVSNRFALEVTDPTGAVASTATSPSTTPDGGSFEGSHYNGGPLSFVLGTDDTLRSGDEYKIRVLYYTGQPDSGEWEPITWKVYISRNDALANVEKDTLHRGTTQYVDSDDYGPYWSDYIYYTP